LAIRHDVPDFINTIGKRYQLLQQENSIARQQAQDQQYVVEQDQGTVEVDEANLESANQPWLNQPRLL